MDLEEDGMNRYTRTIVNVLFIVYYVLWLPSEFLFGRRACAIARKKLSEKLN